MNSDKFKQILFLLLAVACFTLGFWALLFPTSWFTQVPLNLSLTGPLNEFLAAHIGATYIFAGIASIVLVRGKGEPKMIHWGLTILFSIMCVIYVRYLPTAAWSQNLWGGLFYDFPLMVCVLTLIPWSSFSGKGFSRAKAQTGSVKWFNPNKGFGFILTDEGEELFVHYRSVEGKGRRVLRDGDKVSFTVAQGDKGPQAEKVKKI